MRHEKRPSVLTSDSLPESAEQKRKTVTMTMKLSAISRFSRQLYVVGEVKSVDISLRFFVNDIYYKEEQLSKAQSFLVVNDRSFCVIFKSFPPS